KKLIITSAEALSFPISENVYDYILKIKISDKFDISLLSLDLINLGYERCEITESKGQFSIRGSIIDIFSINSENPIRIDFFADEIESIKYFDSDNQTSLYAIDNAEIYPCKEIIFTKEEENKILKCAEDEIEKRLNAVKNLSDNSSLKEEITDNLNQLRNCVLSRPSYLSKFTNKSVNFLSYVKDAIIVTDSINSIISGYSDHIKNYTLLYSQLYEKGKAFACEIDSLFKFDKLLEIIQQQQVLYTEQLYAQKNNTDINIDINVRITANYFKTYQSCKDALVSYINNKYKIVFCLLKDNQKENINEIISSYELKENSDIKYIYCELPQGFELYKSKIVFISATEILKTHIKKPSASKNAKDKLKFFSDIAPGDFVVHDIFGIGKYKGCEQILSEGVRKDFAVIEYAQESMMYVPLDQMHTVSKYIGNSDNVPRLSKLGSTEWKESKAKTKRAVEQMAAELLELYSKREQAQGYAFAKDSVWQSEFENAFIYEETDEQLKCIDEIKADMEDTRPMDRLLCGDVGYGKTEVAQRAAFKAVDNNKQVAVLVPTTVLALQHYKNFCERFSSFPITIEMMSRFKTKAQQTEIAKRIKAGKIDILIGTHRILSDDVAFKDLGLLIIDEEQRFGVAHKEKIKKYKTNIDVLTLTATPIPRTLHMSMIGIRDISIINEPPKNRYPVITFV
ncbi:MAG: DEAD/DEAH box helicase, partial [Eubacteriaceae bacterium]|nr:DEAD/DEAH box helicase [Eubacteriaceae bacterium]